MYASINYLHHKFRVTCLERTKFEKLLHEGFSSNYMFMNWCIMGGFLTHILLANYLSVLIQPKYEKGVQTSQVEEISESEC